MYQAQTLNKSRLGHAEQEMLHETLLDWCSQRNLHPQSEEGQGAAKELIDLFDIGVRDQSELREAIASK
jgi:hypothetical protein